MQSIRIDVGSIRIAINDDENRVIEFNPNDVAFVENFYGLMREFEAKEQEYSKRLAEISANEDLDSNGIPKNIEENLVLVNEVCVFLREQIDKVFGEGTCQTAFGNANTIDMFEQFLVGVTPFIQKSREDKIAKYTTNRTQRRGSAKVMK